MKATILKSFYGMIMFVCLGFIAGAQTTIAINGPTAVCKNGTTNYNTPSPTTGISYQWTMSSAIGVFSTIYGASTSVFWSVPGTTTITIQGKNSANVVVEMGTKTVTVNPLPQPTISTDYRVACQNFPDSTRKQEQSSQTPLFDDGGCPKVCEGSWVTYTATGFPGSSFVWTVSGGTAFPSGNTCLVHWGAIGMGNVSVVETSTAGCQGTRDVCIEIIGKPHARFGAMPDTLADFVQVCLRDYVLFVDHSYATSASPIVNWYWDFGDGQTFSSSASTNPTHQYLNPGGYTVMLVVKNACNCTDTMRMKVEVSPDEGVKIICASVVCEKDKSHYSLQDPLLPCGSYDWTAIGGTIISGPPYGPSIDVVWDNVDDDGFGYLQFDASSCQIKCPGITTIKIPVVKQVGVIKGTIALCPNKEYKYTLPAWPGTFYTWSLSNPAMGILSHSDQPNEIVFTPTATSGSVTIHCDYTTPVSGCKGSADLKVQILPPDNEVGDLTVCLNSTSSVPYHMASGSPANWTLIAPNGAITTYPGVTSINPVFTQTGVYSLGVVGNFCSPTPLQIKVLGLPTAPNAISGPDTVCLNVPYDFTASATIPGTIFDWTVVGGVVVGPASGKTVTVKFTAASGPYEVHVRRSLVQSPYCSGPEIFKTLYKPVININIAGQTIVCPNSVWAYTGGYYSGETYEWTINNPLLGSIDDNKKPNINVTWNNQGTAVTAILTLKVTRCGSSVSQSYNVQILPAPIMSLNASDSVCRGGALSVNILSTPALTSGTLTWSATGSAITSPVTITGPGSLFDTYTFTDISTGNLSKNISVIVTNPNGCSATVTLNKAVTVKPAPIALITPAGPIGICGTVSQPLTATLQSGAGVTSTLTWSTGPSCSTPFPCNPITATAFGNYYVTAMGTNGCASQSNVVNIYSSCPTGTCTVVPAPTFVATIAGPACGHARVQVQYSAPNYSSGPSFTFDPTAFNVVTSTGTPGGTPAQIDADFPAAGQYNFGFDFIYMDVNSNPCPKHLTIPVTVPLVSGILYTLTCSNSTGYSIQLLDHSTYYQGVSAVNYRYSVDGGAYSAATTSTTFNYGTISAGTTHTISIAVGYTYNGITYAYGTGNPACISNLSVVVPGLPVASFLPSPIPATCAEQRSIQLINTSTAATAYNWTFGDLSSTTLTNPNKTYGAAFAGSRTITLTASNAFGCSSVASQNVTIVPNSISGTLSVSPTTICDNGTALLSFSPALAVPAQYQWMNDVNQIFATAAPVNSITVGQSGNYWVHVTDQFGCWKNSTAPPTTVTVLHVPDAVITGDSLQCVGNTFTLYGYAGSAPGITYSWTRNAGIVGTTPNLVQSGLAAGTYQYQLTITVTSGATTCNKVSALYTVIVHPAPAAPTISFTVPNCNPYTLQLTANPPAAGTYNWSNGTSGNPITTFVGGPYRVWYTDNYGCTVTADKDVPKDPAGYLWIFPTGCYTICPPVAIPGPIIPFVNWAFYNPGGPILSSGSNSIPATFFPTTSGYYGMYLYNGYCKANIDTLDLTVDCHGTSDTCKGLITSMTIKYDQKNCTVFPSFTFTNLTGMGLPYTITSSVGTVAPPNNTGVINPGTSGVGTQWIPPAGFNAGVVTFYVTITMPDGSTCGNTITVAIRCPSGGPVQRSASNNAEILLTAAPNPARNTTLITYSYSAAGNSSARTVELYDMVGRRVAVHQAGDAASGTWTLNLDEFAAGVYQVVMKERGNTVTTLRLSVTK